MGVLRITYTGQTESCGDGDWRIEMVTTFDYDTTKESEQFVVYKDKDVNSAKPFYLCPTREEARNLCAELGEE